MKEGLEVAYANLAVAVVEQAAKDLRSYPRDVEQFFCSDRSIFSLCMPHCDGNAVLKQIKENYNSVGRFFISTKYKEEGI